MYILVIIYEKRIYLRLGSLVNKRYRVELFNCEKGYLMFIKSQVI